MKNHLIQLLLIGLITVLLCPGCGKEKTNPYLESIEIEQLLVKPKPSPEVYEKVREQAENVLKQLKEGADFAEMARKYSSHSSKSRGGKLTLTRGWMPDPFDEVVFSMPDSSLSPVISTPEAFYIVYREYGQYLQVRTSHILIAPDKDKEGRFKEQALKEAKRKAWALYRRLKRGESFYDLARQYSDDKNSGQNGGDLGWKKRGSLITAYEKVAYAQEPGQISEPVLTPFGYHIIRTVQKKDLSLHLRIIEFEVPVIDTDRRKARLALEQARKQVLAGTDMETVAMRFAKHPAGEFKYNKPYAVRKNLLVPELAAQIEKMEEGEVSSILEGDTGFYFVRFVKKL